MARCLFFASSVLGTAPIPHVTTGPANALSCSLAEMLRLYAQVRTWSMSFRLAISGTFTGSDGDYPVTAIYEMSAAPVTSHIPHDFTIDATNFDESFLVYGGGIQVRSYGATGDAAGIVTISYPDGTEIPVENIGGYPFDVRVNLMRGTFVDGPPPYVTKLASADVYYPVAEIYIQLDTIIALGRGPAPTYDYAGISGIISFSAGVSGGSNRTLTVSLDGHTWTVPGGLTFSGGMSADGGDGAVITSEEMSPLVLTPLDYWPQTDANGVALFDAHTGAALLDDDRKPLWLTAKLT